MSDGTMLMDGTFKSIPKTGLRTIKGIKMNLTDKLVLKEISGYFIPTETNTPINEIMYYLALDGVVIGNDTLSVDKSITLRIDTFH